MDVNTHASGSSIEFLVNRRFKGVLQKISSKTNGFEKSTTMDSGRVVLLKTNTMFNNYKA